MANISVLIRNETILRIIIKFPEYYLNLRGRPTNDRLFDTLKNFLSKTQLLKESKVFS